MKCGKILLLGFIISLSAAGAQAQSQKSGMKTLYLGNDRTGSSIPSTAATKTEEKKKDALARALEKYERLNDPQAEQATAPQTRDSAIPVMPERISMPRVENGETASRPPKTQSISGFASIIQDYKESKKSRSKMRSKTISGE